MKSIILTIMLAAVFSACGKSAAETSATNTANSRSENSSSSPSSSPELTRKDDEPKDMTPLTMTVSDFVGSYDASNEGRMVTVTGGLLENIAYNALRIRNGSSGYAFYCNGSFSDYTKMSAQIDSLSRQGKSPVATVKGIYKKGVGSGAALESCILTDLEK